MPLGNSTAPKKVGWLLGVGIFWLPYVFAWLTLRRGHTNTARIISFAWLFILVFSIAASGGKNNSQAVTEQPPTTVNKTRTEPQKESKKLIESIHQEAEKITQVAAETKIDKYSERQIHDCEDSILANIMARKFVTGKLKSPSTADFSGYGDTGTYTKYLGDCSHEIYGYVDSQNGFGAMVRTKYYAIVKNVIGTDEWKLIMLQTE